jgi:heme/copper-type cytochrome/quinol oxidase subunit 2
MKYKIQRGINEYGPYTLADLQRYVAQGNISLTDLARSEGMTEWVPVSQIIGNISTPPPPAAPTAAAGTVYSGTPATVAPAAGAAYGVAQAPAVPVAGPVPPDLHWALVLLIGAFASIFILVWIFIEAGFVKKLRPQSNHLALMITGLAIQFGTLILCFICFIALAASSANTRSNEPPVGPLIFLGVLFVVGMIGGVVVHIIGNFKMRDAMVEYYNTVEPINLRLSGVMTFFFAVYYFQYHFSRIAAWKKTGYLVPQQ